MVRAALALLALTAATPAPAPPRDGPDPVLQVLVDSARRVVTLRSGPHHLAAGDPKAERAEGPMHRHGQAAPFRRFHWPTDGWLRAVRLRVLDADGQPLDRRLVHHVNLINLDRRMLFYDIPEVSLAMGQETEDIVLPASIGVPIAAGTEMGLALMWHNSTTVALDDVTLELQVEWSPTNLFPRPLDVLPVYLDVADPVGRPADFDLPTGDQVFSAEFTMPLEGRVIGVGGHIHDHGTALVLDDISGPTPRRVVTLDVRLDAERRVAHIDRQYPGIRGSGIRLVRGRTYRLTGRYDNRTGRTIPAGAMVHMVLLFVPADPGAWPQVHRESADWRAEMADLEKTAAAGGGHVHP